MSDNNLTSLDKTALLASMDYQQATTYDAAFYSLLVQAEPPFPHEIDDAIRRAVAKYMQKSWPFLKSLGQQDECDIDATAMGAMTEMFFIGYELGRRMRKPLTAGVNKPERRSG